jgi:hypothetical protein
MRAGTLDWSGASRSLLFALAGILFFVFWVVARPSYEMTASMTEWPNVLWFSATLLSLAVALPVFGRMLGGRPVVRLASIAGAAVGLSSVANVFEDGLRIEAFFFAFILGTLILDVALLALTIVIARTVPDRYRLLASIPAGTVAGILFFVAAGGPIMLITWLAAAAAAVMISRQRTQMPATPTTS